MPGRWPRSLPLETRPIAKHQPGAAARTVEELAGQYVPHRSIPSSISWVTLTGRHSARTQIKAGVHRRSERTARLRGKRTLAMPRPDRRRRHAKRSHPIQPPWGMRSSDMPGAGATRPIPSSGHARLRAPRASLSAISGAVSPTSPAVTRLIAGLPRGSARVGSAFGVADSSEAAHPRQIRDARSRQPRGRARRDACALIAAAAHCEHER